MVRGRRRPFFWRSVKCYERSLFIIKPDAVKRNLIGRILSFVETSGLPEYYQ